MKKNKITVKALPCDPAISNILDSLKQVCRPRHGRWGTSVSTSSHWWIHVTPFLPPPIIFRLRGVGNAIRRRGWRWLTPQATEADGCTSLYYTASTQAEIEDCVLGGGKANKGAEIFELLFSNLRGKPNCQLQRTTALCSTKG